MVGEALFINTQENEVLINNKEKKMRVRGKKRGKKNYQGFGVSLV